MSLPEPRLIEILQAKMKEGLAQYMKELEDLDGNKAPRDFPAAMAKASKRDRGESQT